VYVSIFGSLLFKRDYETTKCSYAQHLNSNHKAVGTWHNAIGIYHHPPLVPRQVLSTSTLLYFLPCAYVACYGEICLW